LGKIKDCILKRDIASITFSDGNMARKAVLLDKVLEKKPSNTFKGCKCEFDDGGNTRFPLIP
jgi:hypothetical protein